MVSPDFSASSSLFKTRTAEPSEGRTPVFPRAKAGFKIASVSLPSFARGTIMRGSRQKSTAPTKALSIRKDTNESHAISSALNPEFSSAAIVNATPPTLYSRAILEAAILASAPMVRSAFKAGPAASAYSGFRLFASHHQRKW